MADTPVKYREVEAPTECPSCIAWHAEYQRCALLLELLAADHFPDQAAFDVWVSRQMGIALRASDSAMRKQS